MSINIWLHVSLASLWQCHFFKQRPHGHGKVHGPHCIVLSMKFCTMLRPTIIYTSVQALALPALALAILTHHPRAVFRHFASAEVQGSISGAIPENVHFETVNLEPVNCEHDLK